MTYKTVLRSLLEVFPQIDLRILKSVAIEYPKDVDEAVEFILSDVLPVISQPVTSYTPDIFHDTEDSFDERGTLYAPAAVANTSQAEDNNNKQYGSQSQKNLDNEMNSDIYYEFGSQSENKSFKETPHDTSLSFACTEVQAFGKDSSPGVATNSERFCDELEGQDANVQEQCFPYCNSNQVTYYISDHAPFALSSVSIEPVSLIDDGSRKTKDVSLHNEYDTIKWGTSMDVYNMKGCCQGVEEATVGSFISGKILEEPTPLVKLIITGKENEKASINSKSQIPKYLFQPDQSVQLDCLEGDIARAENSQKKKMQDELLTNTLTSMFDSVVNMLKKVEHHKGLAKQAKEEVSLAGEDILKKAKELCHIANNMKETNNKRAGEINGEMSVLGTKAQEIQNQLLTISDERDKCISMIKEIGLILDARLAAAKIQEAEALRMKLEKEEMAHKALDEQEFIVDCLVQESKRLEEEAEENAKLKKFLEVRGYMVDTLKGEIAFVYEHVVSLKGRVEGCTQLENPLVPFADSSLATPISPSEENLSSKSTGHSLLNTNTMTVVEDPLKHDLLDNVGSTSVTQSLEKSTVPSTPSSSLITLTSPLENTALSESASHSLVSDPVIIAKEPLDINMHKGVSSDSTSNSLEKKNALLEFISLDTSSAAQEGILVGSPITIFKDPADSNLQAKANGNSQTHSDDDWEIFDESELYGTP